MGEDKMEIIKNHCSVCKEETQSIADMKAFKKTGYSNLKCKKCGTHKGNIGSSKSINP